MKSIIVCGVGSLGSFLTLSLCQDLPSGHEITILDMDVVEERNLRNQAYSPRYIGYPKVEALEDIIFSQYEREISTIYKKFGVLNTDNFRPSNIKNYDLVLDCFDNHHARSWVQYGWMEGSPVEVLHIGFSEKMTFEISWAENYSVPSDIESGFDICTEPGAGSFIRMISALGSQVIQEFLSTNRKREFLGNRFSVTEIL